MERGHSSAMIPLDPFDRRARPDPYPIYAYLRTVEPVHRSPVGYWVLTRYEDCRAVLEDKRWSHDADAILEPTRGDMDPVDITVRILRAGIAFSDPPHHARHRRVLEQAVRANSKTVPSRAATAARGLVKLMRDKESKVDLARDFAFPLPMVVLSDMLGIPPPDRAQLQRWARELVAGVDPNIRPAAVLKAGAAAAGVVEYLLDRLDAARRGEQAGMIAAIGDQTDRLSTFEQIADIGAFLVIGLEACGGLIGNAMLALLRNPDALRQLKADPSLIGPALEELIRFDGPLHLTARVATEELTVGSFTVPRGEQVVVLMAAADRDPARFSNPDTLDLRRADNQHLGFGLGVHACFAAPLARTIGSVAIRTLLESFDTIEQSGDPAWSDTVTLRSLTHLPIACS